MKTNTRKNLWLGIAFSSILFVGVSCSNPPYTTEDSLVYSSCGKVRMNKTTQIDPSQGADSIQLITYEFLDKKGDCYLKYSQKNDDSPAVIEFEKISNRTEFADDEEKSEITDRYYFIKHLDPALFEKIKFNVE
ncbi:MAG: hypothetical protein CVU05_04235 [Bacteroidetes bacterium HGW-Bacteroidetes-21]|jgi:hypothetical protein|nr:MAG: hypothetical protein CVU05_04235 [Bacteroidetes bacterium HGW-Bacteroidetes-21]